MIRRYSIPHSRPSSRYFCRRESLTSRDLALRDSFPQISSLTFGTTTFSQFSGLKYLPVVSLYWSSPSFFNQQAFATSANFLFTGSEVRSCESSDFARLSSNDSWLDSSPSVLPLSSEPNKFRGQLGHSLPSLRPYWQVLPCGRRGRH